MANTVISLCRDFAEEMGLVHTGIATGGGTTTCTDSSYITKDDVWTYGWIYIDSTTDSLAPQGEASEISASVCASDATTFTVGTLTAAIGAGDIYTVVSKAMRLEYCKRLLNRALHRMGPLPCVDNSLSMVSGTQKYSLPVACKGQVLRVYFDRHNDSSDPDWEERVDWHELPLETGGTAGYLIFDDAVYDTTAKIIYLGAHANKWANTDTISEYVPQERIIAEMAYLHYLETKRRTEGESRGLVTDFNIAAQELELARKLYPLWNPGPAPRLIRRGLDDQ